MAKTGFYLRGASGKLAGATIFKSKHGTVMREIVKPSNPRTAGQMTQRSRFISAVRFFQRGNQRFFKFAFEGKRSGESDFNAFMRYNAKLGPYVTKAQADNIGMPMVAPWILTQGSIKAPETFVDYDNSLGYGYQNLCVMIAKDYQGEKPTTMGQLSQLLRQRYPELMEGDFVTFLNIKASNPGRSFVNDLNAEDINNENEWRISQFVIDSASEESLFNRNDIWWTSIINGSLVLACDMGDDIRVAAAACIFSRNTPSGLKVSNSQLSLTFEAEAAYNEMRTDAHKEAVIANWNAAPSAILQGSEVPKPVVVATKLLKLDGKSLPYFNIPAFRNKYVGINVEFDGDIETVNEADFSVDGSGVSIVMLDKATSTLWLQVNSTAPTYSQQLYYKRDLVGSVLPGYISMYVSKLNAGKKATLIPTNMGYAKFMEFGNMTVVLHVEQGSSEDGDFLVNEYTENGVSPQSMQFDTAGTDFNLGVIEIEPVTNSTGTLTLKVTTGKEPSVDTRISILYIVSFGNVVLNNIYPTKTPVIPVGGDFASTWVYGRPADAVLIKDGQVCSILLTDGDGNSKIVTTSKVIPAGDVNKFVFEDFNFAGVSKIELSSEEGYDLNFTATTNAASPITIKPLSLKYENGVIFY